MTTPTTITPESPGKNRVISYLETGMVLAYVHGGFYRVGFVGLRKVTLIPCSCNGKRRAGHTLKLEKYKVIGTNVYFLRRDAPLASRWRWLLWPLLALGVVVAVLALGGWMEVNGY